jgi:2-polyprenyl-6-methoxyphenol hydroxylase-like FAD-dependent oxidoreductase
MSSGRTPCPRPRRVAIIGAGPAGLALAAALARRGGYAVHVFERGADHTAAREFDPMRSYTIDITGHGINAVRYLDATRAFDNAMLPFKGINAICVKDKVRSVGWRWWWPRCVRV